MEVHVCVFSQCQAGRAALKTSVGPADRKEVGAAAAHASVAQHTWGL